MYFRKKTSVGRAYLQIVESQRDGGAVRQQVICDAREDERGRSRAATPDAVKRSTQFDLGGSNAIRKHEIDRAGIRIGAPGKKTATSPPLANFRLNTSLPSEIRLNQDDGKFGHCRDTEGAGAFLLQVFISLDLGQNGILKPFDKRFAQLSCVQ
jgi:hypothetical protein